MTMFSLFLMVVQGEKDVKIGVIGSGISGASTAFYLSQSLPHAKITIFEKSKIPGGRMRHI